tara:strand:+ start:843 stop:1016 length:174 start_codon:yes stop_codon:yes gene_type:complete
MPTFNNNPITLNGMPKFISGFDIFSAALELYLPTKKPLKRNGIMFKKKMVIVLNLLI